MSLNNTELSKQINLPNEPVILNQIQQPSQTELLLQPDGRKTLIPKYTDIWAAYKKHESAIWHAHEVKLNKDKEDWDGKLTEGERKFIKHVLAFFASSDLIVNENLASRFSKEVQLLEARTFYIFQMFMENVHSETYANLIETYITDASEKEFLLNAVVTIECVKKKAAWAQKWIESSECFAERLIAFAIVEGVFFSGSFCAIYWLQERGLMPGFAMANDFIARDEGMHTDFACLLYSKYVTGKVSQERVEAIFSQAVEIEIEFITEALPCRLIGMNSNEMSAYIKFVANRLMKQLGHKPMFMEMKKRENSSEPELVKQPFAFMNRIALNNKSNFFERDPTEYQKVTHDSTEDDAFANI